MHAAADLKSRSGRSEPLNRAQCVMHLSQLRPSAILVDLDGTIVDSEPLWEEAGRMLAKELGLPFNAEIRAQTIGTPASAWVPSWLAQAGSQATVAEVAAELEAFVIAGISKNFTYRPGAELLLESIANSPLPSALVSASSRLLVDTVLDALPEGIFDASVSGEDVENPKPDPEPYILGAALLGTAPENCLAIEDSVVGGRSAAAAGCTVLWVPTDPLSEADEAWIVLESLKDMNTDVFASFPD